MSNCSQARSVISTGKDVRLQLTLSQGRYGAGDPMGTREIFDDLNLVVRLNQHIQQVTAAPIPAHSPRNAPSSPAASALPRQSSFKVLANLETVSTRDLRECAQFDHQRDLFTATDTSRLPFHLQGDRDFNEGEALSKRRALRFSGALRDKIVFLWDVARGGKQVSAITSGGTSASNEEMNEQDYMTLMLLIFKVLRDDFTLELARKQIHCDWDVDSRHGQVLMFDQFFSAMFELVDMWTCDVEEATYVRFIELLLHRVTVRVVVFLDDNTLKLAMSDNFDEAVVVKSIPLSTISRFASVARIVAPRGVRTIGELASADPAMVEQERVDYLRRNSVSGNSKIGSELQDLLAMFRKLAQTFEHADYDLEDNQILRRRQSVPASGAGGAQSVVAGSMSSFSAQNQAYDGGSHGRGPDYVDLGKTTTAIGAPNALPPSGPGWCLTSSANDQSLPVSGGRKRLNSIHDISQADPDLVTALKTSFLIEKRISLERQTDMSAIREELVKFGAEGAAGKDDEAAKKQYATLYEMFVIRDGDDLKALAQVMLQQIKAELTAHGITVDDDADAEDAYDHFYDAVVTGTGETIVADAQQWMQQTLTAGTVGAYVKKDYHELKPVDEVALLGTQIGDDEFVSLIAKDEADEQDSVQRSRGDRRKSSSPIQRKPSQLQGKSFPQIPKKEEQIQKPRGLEDSSLNPMVGHKREKAKVKRHEGNESDESQDSDSPENGKSRKNKSKRDKHKKKSHVDDTAEISAQQMGDTGKLKESSSSDANSLNGKSTTNGLRSDTSTHDDEPNQQDKTSNDDTVHHRRKSGRRRTTRTGISEATDLDYDGEKQDSNNRDKQRHRSSASSKPVEAVSSTEDSDAERERRRAENMAMSSRSGPLAADSGLEDTIGNHMDIEDQNRDPQGVDFVFEEDSPERVGVELKPEPTRPIDLPPKIPQIAIGGVASSNSIAVAGRYIQLLGLGDVVTHSDETELFKLLESDEGKECDLVCFDIGSDLDIALEKLRSLQALVGKCVILLGGVAGEVDASSPTQIIAAECLSAGAVYFATLPINFPLLREKIYSFFESSTRPYILRSRKPAGRAAAVFQAAGRTIGTAGMFAHQDVEEPSRKLSAASAAVAHSGKGGTRKPTIMIPGMLPSIGSGTPTHHRLSIKAAVGSEEARPPEMTPTMPLTPRSLKSYKKSPRLSAALNKLIR